MTTTDQFSSYARMLSDLNLFNGISVADIQDLISHSKIVKSDPGTTLIKEGDLISGLHIILDGAVDITKNEHTEITDLEAGSFFGEISLFGQMICATATVTSPKGCIALIIQRGSFDLWFRKDPAIEGKFFRNLATELCNRLANTTDRLTVALAKK